MYERLVETMLTYPLWFLLGPLAVALVLLWVLGTVVRDADILRKENEKFIRVRAELGQVQRWLSHEFPPIEDVMGYLAKMAYEGVYGDANSLREMLRRKYNGNSDDVAFRLLKWVEMSASRHAQFTVTYGGEERWHVLYRERGDFDGLETALDVFTARTPYECMAWIVERQHLINNKLDARVQSLLPLPLLMVSKPKRRKRSKSKS
jgi:hypothetical protein